MKKWVWIGFVALLIISGALVFTLSNLGPIIKAAVNSQGPRITQTKVHVDRVRVSLLSGEAGLHQLLIGNPQGFSAPDAMKMGAVYLDVDKNSLTGKTIVINRIEVDAPEITYERNKNGDNFQAILNNVKQATGAGGGAAPKPNEPAPSGKKLIIRDFVVKNGKVALYIAAGRSVTADLPEIHLQNIGTAKNGVEPARAVQEMLAAVYQYIRSPAVLDSLKAQLTKLNIQVDGMDLNTLSEKLKEGKGVGDKLKGIFGNH